MIAGSFWDWLERGASVSFAVAVLAFMFVAIVLVFALLILFRLPGYMERQEERSERIASSLERRLASKAGPEPPPPSQIQRNSDAAAKKRLKQIESSRGVRM